jgi:hypothetical protein
MKPEHTEANTVTAPSVGSGALFGGVFRIEEVTRKTRLRWFLQRGDETYYNRGFRNKQDVRNWIESLGKRLDWRVGFVFRLKGDTCEMSFVDSNGKTSAEHES